MYIIKLLIIFCGLSYSQTPIINNIKQIDESVRNKLLLSSKEYIDFKQNVIESTNTINNNISNLNSNLRYVILQTTTNLQQQIDNISIDTTALSNIFVLKSGDSMSGSLDIGGQLNVSTMGIVSNGDITTLGDLVVVGNINTIDGIFSNYSIPLKISDKTSYLDYNKLYIRGDVDIEGNYLKNGQPVSIGSGTYIPEYISTNVYNLDFYGFLSDKNFIVVAGEEISENATSLFISTNEIELRSLDDIDIKSTNNVRLISDKITLDSTNELYQYGNQIYIGNKNPQTFSSMMYICEGGDFNGQIFTNTTNLCNTPLIIYDENENELFRIGGEGTLIPTYVYIQR